MSAYYTAGAAAPATDQSTPAPVLVAFAGPAPQSRLTVAFRILMAIPQLIVLWLLGVAAIVITIIGWFGALFTGRLPVFAADFLLGSARSRGTRPCLGTVRSRGTPRPATERRPRERRTGCPGG